MSSVQTESGTHLRGLAKHAQDLIEQKAEHKKWKRLRGLLNGNLKHGFDAVRPPAKTDTKRKADA